MTDCCGVETRFPKNAVCPANGKRYRSVQLKTVLHQLQKPWTRDVSQQVYYFCSDPDCDIVFFSQDSTVFRTADLRCEVGQKSRSDSRTICYCFDISYSDILEQPAQCRSFVVEHTRSAQCDCEVRNPSARCCLVDFPKI